MSQTPPATTVVVSVRKAMELLGYQRAAIYRKLQHGDLRRGVDHRGRRGVTLQSIQDYLASPPPGTWGARHPGTLPDTADSAAGLRAENLRLREIIERLRMARDEDASAAADEASANRHLRKAIKHQARAGEHRRQVENHLDELLTLFLTPDDVSDAEPADPEPDPDPADPVPEKPEPTDPADPDRDLDPDRSDRS